MITPLNNLPKNPFPIEFGERDSFWTKYEEWFIENWLMKNPTATFNKICVEGNRTEKSFDVHIDTINKNNKIIFLKEVAYKINEFKKADNATKAIIKQEIKSLCNNFIFLTRRIGDNIRRNEIIRQALEDLRLVETNDIGHDCFG